MDKLLNKLVWLILIVPAIYLFAVWNKIPKTVGLHFGWDGKADRLGSREELITMTLLMIPAIGLIYLLLINIYRVDPKKFAAENRQRLKRLGFGVVVFMSAILCMIIYNAVTGSLKTDVGWILAATGLLFAFIGNYLPNLKPNYFAGLRLPWTLENEENWKRTHALAGKLWFSGGLFLAIICIFLHGKAAMIVFIAIMSVITIIPIIYSYRLFVKQKRTVQ
jgi:uncharacterized membrane protein